MPSAPGLRLPVLSAAIGIANDRPVLIQSGRGCLAQRFRFDINLQNDLARCDADVAATLAIRTSSSCTIPKQVLSSANDQRTRWRGGVSTLTTSIGGIGAIEAQVGLVTSTSTSIRWVQARRGLPLVSTCGELEPL